MKRWKRALEGIFTGDVIASCFEGEARAAENECIELIGDLYECYFSLIVDPEDQLIVDGHVL